jgi:hypothetical protein
MEDIINSIQHKMEDIINSIQHKMEDIINSLQHKMADIINSIQHKMADIINSIQHKMEDIINSIQHKMEDIINSLQHMIEDWLIVYCFVSFSRIFHSCRDVTIVGEGRATIFRPMLSANSLRAGSDLYCATPAVTRDLGFCFDPPSLPFVATCNPNHHGVTDIRHHDNINSKSTAQIKAIIYETYITITSAPG